MLCVLRAACPPVHFYALTSLKLFVYFQRPTNSYYETIRVLGVGSMGSVSKVKKRQSVIGGSARQDYVNSIHGVEGFCFSLPIIGHILRSCTGKDLGQRVKINLFVASPSTSVN